MPIRSIMSPAYDVRTSTQRPFRVPSEQSASAMGFLMILMVVALALTACAPTPWQQAYRAEPGLAAPASPMNQRSLRVREVPWQRLAPALDAQHEAEVASDVPPDQWPVEKRATLQEGLLRQLQFPQPQRVELLGRSLFVTTSFAALSPGELDSFARRIGADEAVYATRDMGTAERIDREWVFYDRFDNSLYHDAGSRRSVFPDRTASSVPVVRLVPQTQFAIFWIRQRD